MSKSGGANLNIINVISLECRLWPVRSFKQQIEWMNSIQEKRHEELYAKIQDLEKQTSMLATDLKELKDGYKHLEADLAEVKKDVESKADNAFVSELERRIIDLQNRSRRNNLVFWNVSEGSEKDVTRAHGIGRS